MKMETASGNLRLKSLLHTALTILAGLILISVFHRTVLGGILIGVACVMGIALQVSPGLRVKYDHFNRALIQWIGLALNWVMFSFIYLLIFLPGRLFLVLVKSDPMRRAFPGQESTYWLPSVASGDYHRQY